MQKTAKDSINRTVWPGRLGLFQSNPWLLAAQVGLGSVAALAIGLSLAGIPLRLKELLNLKPFVAYYTLGLEILLALIFFIMAGIIVWRRPRHPVALFLALTLIVIGATETGMTDALINPANSTDWLAWRWSVWSLRAIASSCALLMLYVLPDGRFVPRLTAVLAVMWVILNFLWLLFPDLSFNAVYGSTWRATRFASFFWVLGWYGSGILAQIYRYRHVTDAVQRQQTKWVAVGLVALVLGGVIYYGLQILVNLPPGTDFAFDIYVLSRPTLWMVLTACFPVCLGIAIVRYHLFDLDLIINRALVYGALTASTMGLYVVVVGGLGELLETGSHSFIPFLATGLVAVLFYPLRDWLQRGVNRLMYGERDEPYRVVSRLGQRLEAAIEPGSILPTIVETVATALKLPYAAIALKQGHIFVTTAVYPDQVTGRQKGRKIEAAEVTVPLTYASEMIGQLIVAPRSPGETFSATDYRLLNDLARPAGVAAHALLLAADLERSRMRIVTAREEARRRLGSDLHDGLGHRLAGLLRRVETAANWLATDPAAAQVQLNDIRQQIKTAIDEVRSLAHTLHPPELELLGLVDALQERVGQMSEPGGLQVQFDVPAALPPLTAATEAAAYYIILEALSNVQRHAEARHCYLRVALVTHAVEAAPLLNALGGPILEVEVRDDGRGLATGDQRGLGLISMQERAVEVGGRCVIETLSTGGTRVLAQLPCLDTHL